MRFYDLAEGNSLDSSGERYCFTSPPAFSYTSEIQVLFKSNNDASASTGFDCEVVASATTTTTTTTSTTTTAAPQAADCTTVDGPGVGKACMPFTYGSHRIAYDGCINRATPGQYTAFVPSSVPAPKAEEDAVEDDFLIEISNEVFGSEFSSEFGAISFGPAPRGAVRPRNGVEEMVFRTVFWCATSVDTSSYVMEWGQCAPGCKADPAGSYVPVAPRRGAAPG